MVGEVVVDGEVVVVVDGGGGEVGGGCGSVEKKVEGKREVSKREVNQCFDFDCRLT